MLVTDNCIKIFLSPFPLHLNCRNGPSLSGVRQRAVMGQGCEHIDVSQVPSVVVTSAVSVSVSLCPAAVSWLKRVVLRPQPAET